MACLKALKMPKFPQPGHQAGVLPSRSAKVGIKLSQKILYQKGSAVVSIDRRTARKTGFGP
jgi:hypothetical protein